LLTFAEVLARVDEANPAPTKRGSYKKRAA
jgi:hypothetical protein